MFFKNFLVLLFLKFLWLGLILGIFKIFCNFVCKISHKNIFVINLINFSFWTIFSLFFIYFCFNYYNYQFCWFGFVAVLFGIYFVKISIEFFFTNVFRLLYNKIDKKRLRKVQNGKLKYREKV